mgnify:CR=1 FL=1
MVATTTDRSPSTTADLATSGREIKRSRNGKAQDIMPNLLQSPPTTERIEAIVSFDVPTYHEDGVRRAHAEAAFLDWIKELPEAFRDRITDEVRAEMIEQKFQNLPVGTGDKAKVEYFNHELPNLVSNLTAQVLGLYRDFYAATVGIGADEFVTYEASKTGRSVTIKLQGPRRAAGGGSGRKARKATELPSAVIARDGNILDFVPTLALEGEKLAKAVRAWTLLVKHFDSFDRATCQEGLVAEGGWNVSGNRNWTQVAGNGKVQAYIERYDTLVGYGTMPVSAVLS